MRTLPKMCALEVCNGMRALASITEHYPLRREIVVSPYGSKPAICQSISIISNFNYLGT
jgi:hypothetical protein